MGVLVVKDEDLFESQMEYQYENGVKWYYIIMSKFGETLDALLERKTAKLKKMG